jgi:hypothetical protein
MRFSCSRRRSEDRSRAAMIYQHASRDRAQAIAAAMGTALSAPWKGTRRSPTGTRPWQGFLVVSVSQRATTLSWGFGLERAKGTEPS